MIGRGKAHLYNIKILNRNTKSIVELEQRIFIFIEVNRVNVFQRFFTSVTV